MGKDSAIQWTDNTLNFWLGCDPVHTGCLNCYAQDYFRRFDIIGKRRKTSNSTWDQALKWNRWADYDKRLLEIITEPPGPQIMKKTAVSLERLEKVGYLAENPGDYLGYVPTGKPWRPPTVFSSMMDPFEDWTGPIVNAKGGVLRQCDWCGPVGPATYEPCRISHCPKCDRIGGVKGNTAMSDLRRDMFGLIDRTLNLDYILATKRPENIRPMWEERFVSGSGLLEPDPEYRSNVWLLYSASDQASYEAGIGHLLKCRDLVPVLGLSLEPILEPMKLHFGENMAADEDSGVGCFPCEQGGTRHQHYVGETCGRGIGWVAIGGESGPNARPCRLEWILDIVQQCEAASVALFVKQMGSNFRTLPGWGFRSLFHKFKHPKGGDPAEWPESIRVRQYPEVKP